ncbi:hypothetical protein U9M49_03350 [Cytobacillus sp. OWB-43]|nr:hypothetical protein [Cytobacillus sp. OWB-43]
MVRKLVTELNGSIMGKGRFSSLLTIRPYESMLYDGLQTWGVSITNGRSIRLL